MGFLTILGLVGLGVWIWAQAQRIETLTRRLNDIEQRLAALAGAAPPAASPPQAPLVLDQPLPPDEEEPLLLDTPVPAASNDERAPAAAAPSAVAASPRAARPAPAPARTFEQWLAENGLAWLGGGAFALGAIFLVSYAAQQNWFTPPVQLACAAFLGAGLLAVSEWARRYSIARPPGHPLAAALLAAAGVVAFYVTTWAAHGVYGFIGWSGAAALLTLCAALLVGLSFLHGQALGVLALTAALLAPPLTNAPVWPAAALTLYVCAVGAAGFALAALRRWAWAAVATFIGLHFWFAAAIAADDVPRALALVGFASAGGAALGLRAPQHDETGAPLTWGRVRALGPGVAISIGSVLLVWAWLAIAPAPSGRIAGPALLAISHVALAAYAVRARAAAPASFVVAAAALVVGFAAYQRAHVFYGPQALTFYPAELFASVVVAVSALAARPHRSDRWLMAGAGAIGAALLIALAAFSRPDWHSLAAWSALFCGAALLFAAAWRAAQDAQNPRADRAVDLWAGAGAALALLGVQSLIPAEARAAGHAAAAFAFASGLAWRGWRALGVAALAAAAIALAQALSPGLIGATLANAMPLWRALLILAAAALLLFGASQAAARAGPRPQTAESLSSAAVIVVLIAVFLGLRWIATGGAGTTLGAFAETSLRALVLIVAGHLLMPRRAQQTGRIAAWRGHVLLAAGLIYALFIPGLALNPWWGGPARAAVEGPPLLDGLALAFAAPAALAFAAARRLYARQLMPARFYAGAGGVLALMWSVLELRRAFHAADMSAAPVGLFEGACYGLLALAAAAAIALAARRADNLFTRDLSHIMRGCAWAGLLAAALIMLVLRHPWWGAHDASATGALATFLAVMAQLGAGVLALALGRGLSTARTAEPTRFAAAAAASVFALSFGHAALRWLHHRGAMDDGAALTGLEGFAHALWPLAFVSTAAALTARAPGRDTVRAYLFDLQAIWAAAIWPALAFAGFGLWVLFNPWWGVLPARAGSAAAAALGLGALLLAAWLSAAASRTPHVRWPGAMARTATLACVAHLFVAFTMIVRWLHHRADMSGPPAIGVELWTYSVVWALFGAGLFWLGMRRSDAVLRWSGLALLLGATGKVFLLDTARLAGVIRAASAIGLAVVLLVVAWFARTQRRAPEAPLDLTGVTPGARRERRHGRRQRSP